MPKIQYIKTILKILVNYINHIAEFVEKYNEGIKKICSKSKTDKIIKTEETIKYEKKLLESYEKAMEFYKELQAIADNCRWGMNVGNDIQWFCNRINSARLPIYERVTLRLITPKQNGVPTGGAAMIDCVIQHGTEFAIGRNYGYISYITAKSKIGPDTAGMLDLAHENRIDKNYTKDAIKLTNWNDPRVASDKEYLRGKVIKGFSYYDYDEDDVPGYFFKNYSEPSKRIANDKDFLAQIKNKNKVLNNKEELSVGFTDKNLHNAIGKADIRQRYLDKNGNLHVKVYDTYDFNPEEKNKPLVMAGKNKMLDGELKPFFTIHDIIIPKEKLDELWK